MRAGIFGPRLEDSTTEGPPDGPHVVLTTPREFEAWNGYQVDAKPELGVHGADGAVEFETPAMKITVQTVLLADKSPLDHVEGSLVAELPVPRQVGIQSQVSGGPLGLG